ncbi:acyltransferase family protein [Leptolyngbya sp. AN03gr2]|uniref:acyltransferase family protein n=1 Tax=unclassified Leptolyngbya TaxID=2650499 RepID=UPI003D3143BB
MTQTLISSSKVRFYFIDALRGLAALWVVLFHAHLDERLDSLEQLLRGWVDTVLFTWGSLGVAVFFVLSGFVIAHSLRNATIDFPYLRQFTLRRLIRLTPPYYVSIVITLAFALLAAYAKNEPFQPMGQAFSTERFITHLFYVQELIGFTNFNDVYWTLGLEIQSYLLLCLLIGFAQRLLYQYRIQSAFAIVFVPTALIAAIFPIAIAPNLGRSIVILPLLYSFLLGVFAHWCWQRKFSRLWFYLYSGVLLTAGIIHQAEFTIVSVAIALLLLEVGRAGKLAELLKGSVLRFFGDVSYSLFLTHTPVMGVVFFIGQRILGISAVSDALCLVASILVSLGFATIVWISVEKPAIAWSQSVKLPTTAKAV